MWRSGRKIAETEAKKKKKSNKKGAIEKERRKNVYDQISSSCVLWCQKAKSRTTRMRKKNILLLMENGARENVMRYFKIVCTGNRFA